LEKRGLPLSQLSRLVYYQLPPIIDASRDPYSALVAIIILMNLQVQFSAPLAQGSVTWALRHVPSRVSTAMPLSVAGPGSVWTDSMTWTESRLQLRQRGSATAAMLALPEENYEFPSSYTFSRRRSIALPDLQRLPLNSSLSSVTMPYLAISSLEWIDWDPSLGQFLDKNNFFNWSSGDNPLTNSHPGVTVLTDNIAWRADTKWPEAASLEPSYTLLVLTGRFNDSSLQNRECPPCSGTFGKLPAAKQGFIHWPNNFTNCYLAANVKLSAGTFQGQTCSLVSRQTIDCQHPSSQLQINNRDSLNPTIMSMLPEVMASIALQNISQATTWNNLEGYLAGSYSLAYRAIWSTLNDHWQTESSQSEAKPPLAITRASVSRTRIYVWAMLHALIQLAGVLVMAVQTKCSMPAVRNFPLACLLTDSSRVLDDPALEALSDAEEASRSLSKRPGTIRLRTVAHDIPTGGVEIKSLHTRRELVRADSITPNAIRPPDEYTTGPLDDYNLLAGRQSAFIR
jgi:hypothetical protein